MQRPLSILLCLALAAACRPPPLPEPLRRAAELERSGKDQEALAVYDRLLRGCPREDDRPACRIAALRAAEALERLGRRREALRRYLALRLTTRDRVSAARAQDRAADLLEREGKLRSALQLSRQAIESFPGEVAADDSLRRLLRLQQRLGRPDGETASLILELFRELEGTAVGDNLLFEAAKLYDRKQHGRDALALYDQLAAKYPRSPLLDDALWRAAQLCEQSSDWEGAIRRYTRLLVTRRDALLLGSYDSVYLDDAQLRIGVIRLDRLHDLRGALAAFELLRDDFPTSTLRDDAQLWIAEVHRRRGEQAAACRALERLVRSFPDGNQTEKAREQLRAPTCAKAPDGR